ncbi:uncharacterized protein LOC131664285 [Phymastichus coffea]|uniref:uncharacterized protein LOC131664285 n=1 Tax=Phymastichus coffea TaxID=108790 RepID=UPI00273C6EFF|nr:uncharacterized protein LOC131664285 [Phymastichus coffea]
MNLLSDLAQICAKFVSMKAPSLEERAYKGCLVVQPALLGTPQATYAVGCFLFEQGQVRQAESTELNLENPSSLTQQDQDDDEEEHGLNAEDLLAVVSASAEQSIALFSQWLGFNLTPKVNTTNVNTGESEANTNQRSSANSNISANRHSRTIPLFLESEDKSDEQFKLILSAQDNILKESATIGGSSTGTPTAFLYSQPNSDEGNLPAQTSAVTISPENLVIVPLESRRGGRAYNIHQHVNEV